MCVEEGGGAKGGGTCRAAWAPRYACIAFAPRAPERGRARRTGLLEAVGGAVDGALDRGKGVVQVLDQNDILGHARGGRAEGDLRREDGGWACGESSCGGGGWVRGWMGGWGVPRGFSWHPGSRSCCLRSWHARGRCTLQGAPSQSPRARLAPGRSSGCDPHQCGGLVQRPCFEVPHGQRSLASWHRVTGGDHGLGNRISLCKDRCAQAEA